MKKLCHGMVHPPYSSMLRSLNRATLDRITFYTKTEAEGDTKSRWNICSHPKLSSCTPPLPPPSTAAFGGEGRGHPLTYSAPLCVTSTEPQNTVNYFTLNFF